MLSVQVLAGVKIMFSRIIPLEQQPDTHPLWKLAVRFGATCTSQVSDDVTHVVANVSGTEKVCIRLAASTTAHTALETCCTSPVHNRVSYVCTVQGKHML